MINDRSTKTQRGVGPGAGARVIYVPAGGRVVVARPPLSRRSKPPARASSRFVGLVGLCFVAMSLGMGAGFVFREGQARAAEIVGRAPRTPTQREATPASFVSLSPTRKTEPPPPPPPIVVVKSSPIARRQPTTKATKPLNDDNFESSFRVGP